MSSYFDDYFLGVKQPVVYSCAQGPYLTLSTSMAEVKEKSGMLTVLKV